ncbi:MAG TPA: hypothetical protein VJI15_06550 [Candidatus Nanoarchaeia archaeon]|nr:hypothetical protein [Candidatus Nanoarchaeia archaeon]
MAIEFLSYVWELVVSWLSLLFYIPFKNPHLLWVLGPIWIAWFFAEFFQEKKKTTFGNAISNGVVPVWVSIDWTRLIISQITAKSITFGTGVILKFLICLLAFVYGVIIIVGGIREKGFVHYFGRTREVTYILAAFTPLVYGVVELSGTFFLSIFLFFPVFYFVIEFIDRITPDPEEMEDSESTDSKPSPEPSFPIDSSIGQPQNSSFPSSSSLDSFPSQPSEPDVLQRRQFYP